MAPPDSGMHSAAEPLIGQHLVGQNLAAQQLVAHELAAVAHEAAERFSSRDDDDDGLWLSITSYTRLIIGAAGMGLCVLLFLVPLVVCLPSRPTRIRISNVFGALAGRWMIWCSGSEVVVEGYEEAVARGPAIWAMNHNSLLDIPLGIWFAPSGSVGVGKKQVIFYPFFGVLYVLAGHLRIDRRQTDAAVASMRKMADFVRNNRLSIFIWPEGTRSRDGRLQPMKKGIAHLALQTGLPIQPMVTAGTQRAWPKGPPKVRRTTVHIKFPAPIDTSSWRPETIDQHLEELGARFAEELPRGQRPLAS